MVVETETVLRAAVEQLFRRDTHDTPGILLKIPFSLLRSPLLQLLLPEAVTLHGAANYLSGKALVPSQTAGH